MSDTNEIVEWANGLSETIKKYEFDSITPDKPRVEPKEAEISIIGIDLSSGKVVIGTAASMTTGTTYALNEAIPGNEHFMFGYFTSLENAVSASKKYFNTEKAQELDKLKAEKEELERKIAELEKELS